MNESVLFFIVVGFVAQMIYGALGMAYGVSSMALLLALGISPVAASASVHTAEVLVSSVFGISHFRFGNVDQELFRRLVVPGVLGGVVGAIVLTALPAGMMKPFVALYLIVMGGVIFGKSLSKHKHQEREMLTHLVPLGAVGGFFDAIGGGGWGPIVTSTLGARGNNSRQVIDSICLVEFFVTMAQVAVFITIIGLTHWQVIIGLTIGGILAAPLAVYVCKNVPPRILMAILGSLIILLSGRTVLLALLPM